MRPASSYCRRRRQLLSSASSRLPKRQPRRPARSSASRCNLCQSGFDWSSPQCLSCQGELQSLLAWLHDADRRQIELMMNSSIPGACTVTRFKMLSSVQALASLQEPATPSAQIAAATAESSAAFAQPAATPTNPADQADPSCDSDQATAVPSVSEPQIASNASLASVSPAERAIISSSSKAEPSASHAELDGGPPEECVVCWAAGAEVVFQPCGHLCTCCSCAEPFLGQSLACPMCRATVVEGITLIS